MMMMKRKNKKLKVVVQTCSDIKINYKTDFMPIVEITPTPVTITEPTDVEITF